MKTVTVTGYSDDLIEVDGDIREEWTGQNTDEDGDLVLFSTGTILRVRYNDNGIWRITPVVVNTNATVDIVQAPEEEEDGKPYSDEATVTGDITWVAHGLAYASKK